MKIIASQGPQAFLVEVNPTTHWVYWVQGNTLVKGLPLGSILAHGNGYWEEWEPGPLDEGILKAMEGAEERIIEMEPKGD